MGENASMSSRRKKKAHLFLIVQLQFEVAKLSNNDMSWFHSYSVWGIKRETETLWYWAIWCFVSKIWNMSKHEEEMYASVRDVNLFFI